MLWKIAEVCGLVVLILALVTIGVLLVAACISLLCDLVKVRTGEMHTAALCQDQRGGKASCGCRGYLCNRK